MKKEFKIGEILNAVNSISKIVKKNSEISERKEFISNSNVLVLNNKAKSNKSEILVLDQMIE